MTKVSWQIDRGFEMDIFGAVKTASTQDTDVYAYIGPVDRTGYDMLSRILDERNGSRKKHCMLTIATFGGDPNAGYRIARALSHNYPHGTISMLVPHYCKSAGTLICIGAHELVIADTGELGPLDIQVQKPDEMFKSASGLDIIRGLTYLRDNVLESFRNYLVDINQGSGLSTKSASEIASKLTIGIHEPIFGQIDPMRLGEMQAALTIALEYGDRLNERSRNLKPGALSKLATSYPSHGFVIDRKEARSLFVNVRIPELHELKIGAWLADTFTREARRQNGLVIDCSTVFSEQPDQNNIQGGEESDASTQSSETVTEQNADNGVAGNDEQSQSPATTEPVDGCDSKHIEPNQSI